MNSMQSSGTPPAGNAASQSISVGVNQMGGAQSSPGAHAPAPSNGNMFPVDPNTASFMMNPHAAAAMAAAAAAAVQQMAQQQQGNSSAGMMQNAGKPVPQSPGHLHHHHAPHQAPSAAPAPAAPAPSVLSHHPAPVQNCAAQPVGSNSSSMQQSSLAMMAALFNGLGGAAAAAAGHAKSHPQMQAVAPAPMPYPMATAQPPAPPTSMAAPPASQMGAMPNSPAAVAAAAAQVVAAHSANAATNGAMTNSLLANIKSWKLEQLESHVQLLRDTNQPIPQPVAMLVAEARRKEEKRTAKRVANRKSACTSRARKKALVEEMTKTNARLRRQALILALLPDLVIAITIDGEITFCSAQVERVLRHSNQDLVGSNLSDILVPASKEALRHLIEELVAAERAAADDAQSGAAVASSGESGQAAKKATQDNDAIGNASAQSSSAGEISSGGPVVVSDQSFPPSVVKVQNRRKQTLAGGGDSDLSTSNGGKAALPVSSLTNNSLSRSATNSSFDNQSDEAVQAAALVAKDSGEDGQLKSDTSSPSATKQQPQSSDDSLSSSSDFKNLRKANEALSRNVRWHNEKLLGKSKTGSSKSAHKDDVTGASVTANNADARLSSLQHHPGEEPAAKKAIYENLEEQSSSSFSDSLLAGVEEKRKRSNKDGIENSSEDSGYRESNDSQSSSREDSTSSSSNDKDRPKPLAPTCNVCLIRDDLTTIWCEVTSSIRSRPLKEGFDGAPSPGAQITASSGKSSLANELPSSSSSNSIKGSKTAPNPATDASPPQEVIKELLLCLRPIRDGEEKVDESFRFVPAAKRMEVEGSVTDPESGESSNRPSSSNSKSKVTDSGVSSTKPHESTTNLPNKSSSRPPKKRPLMKQDKVTKVSSDSSSSPAKKSRISSDTEKSVVESLILMSHNSPTK